LVHGTAVYVKGGTLRLLSARMCDAASDEADSFMVGLTAKVPAQHLVTIERDTQLDRPEPEDVVVVFAPAKPGRQWRASVQAYLQQAHDVGADIIPVSLRRDQLPAAPLETATSFSVAETLKSYRLGPAQFREAGSVFARLAVSRLWPTYSRERLKLFLSYRRADAEYLIRILASAIFDLNHQPSRDLADIRPGAAIAASIVREIDESDVFVLCDTPEAAGDHA